MRLVKTTEKRTILGRKKVRHQKILFFIQKIFKKTSTSSCPPILDDLLHPPGHRVTQGADVHGPHLGDGLLQLGHRGDVLAVQLVLHVVPGIFNRIEIR